MADTRGPLAGEATRGAPATALATRLLDDFARATGLDDDGPGRRYLWTDAFAICGFLGLHERTRDQRFLDRAIRLVDRVHRSLGRHRPDDPRAGWISGLDEAAGAERPTAGGLRIGKPLPERPAGEAYHPEQEWERDGQYYHYLTRWMHALLRVWRVTADARYHAWAVDLARAAHRGFVRDGRIHWKMSVDLTRPLVPSSGQHDPLDGRILVESIRATAPGGTDRETLLAAEAAALDQICRAASWITHDALGLGGLLVDALRFRQLRALGRPLDRALEERVLQDATRGLAFFAITHRPATPPSHRLAFRELGLALGLGAIPDIPEVAARKDLRREILSLWTRPESRTDPTWLEHEDINTAMLAVALEPGGYLAL